ncbi:MAG TPA: hypothetical protein VM487_05065 [Phycisphaerae bacterium]|nr:hypothetical protein [Phycisphaerae bacterium]
MSMKLGSGGASKGAFELCPPGPQQLVCCDIIDHGEVMSPGFGTKPASLQRKISLRWMSSFRMADLRPYIVQKRYTLSSHPKSTLRQDLEKWRGKRFTDAEAAAFDLDCLIGVNCFGQIVHLAKPRGTFAEVVTLMPPLPNMPRLIVDPAYVRMKDRPPEDATAPPPTTLATDPPTPADPFELPAGEATEGDQSDDGEEPVPF